MDNPWHKEIWKEGKIIDLWSLNHILGGAVLAGIFLYYNLSLTIALVLTFLISLSWEIYELIKDLSETTLNKAFDIITSLMGVYLMYFIDSLNLIETNALFAIFLFSFIILEVWGFLALANK